MTGVGRGTNPPGDRRAPIERSYNHAVAALDVLYELAEQGSTAARIYLAAIADRAADSAGKLRKFWDRE